MIDSIIKELNERKNYLENVPLQSIYFGGGTPSIIKSVHIEKILNNIYQNFNISSEIEITIESNPEDLSKSKLNELKNIGINRLSIGVQSFNDRELKMLNRSHNAVEAKSAIINAQEIGFTNLSIDLIYGIPNQSLITWEKNLDITFDLLIQHFSAYELTVEKKTTLHYLLKNKKIVQLKEKKILEHYKLLIEKAKKYSFINYEISNFGKEHFFSNHNIGYWTNKHYLGVGPSAHSFNGKSRRWNISSNIKYIQKIKNNSCYFEAENLTIKQKYNELIFTKLRTIWGVNSKEIQEKFGKSIFIHFMQQVIKWENKKYIMKEKEIFLLTDLGKLFADQIASDLFIIN